MEQITQGISQAIDLLVSADAALLEIILLSLQVSGSAVLLACLIGLPLGALLAVTRFPGRGAVILFCNALMGLPPVVVGLI
ncbi:MAG: ABC transporter permease, partial [Pseudomonadota bacterium]